MDLHKHFSSLVDTIDLESKIPTMQLKPENLLECCIELRDHVELQFAQLSDLCAVDYLYYGVGEWETTNATNTGFNRGRDPLDKTKAAQLEHPRFAVVYHLLSIQYNQRIRLKCFVPEPLRVPSVVEIWPGANWYERETFDLFGIEFINHPDLRRILTDYGFIGHPFRKDFPLSGKVEVRFDAALGQVVYEPVQIEERTLVPKVIRKDSRYLVRGPIDV